MLQFDIPGYGALRLEHLVLDYNGTLACDGILIEGARERLGALSNELKIHVLTARRNPPSLACRANCRSCRLKIRTPASSTVSGA